MATHHITLLSNKSDTFGNCTYCGACPVDMWISHRNVGVHVHCLLDHLRDERDRGILCIDQDVEVRKGAAPLPVLVAIVYLDAVSRIDFDNLHSYSPLPSDIILLGESGKECDSLVSNCACGADHADGAEGLYERLLKNVVPLTTEHQYGKLDARVFIHYCGRYGWKKGPNDTYSKFGMTVAPNVRASYEANVDSILAVDGPFGVYELLAPLMKGFTR